MHIYVSVSRCRYSILLVHRIFLYFLVILSKRVFTLQFIFYAELVAWVSDTCVTTTSNKVKHFFEIFYEFIQNLEDMFIYHYMHSDVCNRCTFSTTHYCVVRRKISKNVKKYIHINISSINY